MLLLLFVSLHIFCGVLSQDDGAPGNCPRLEPDAMGICSELCDNCEDNNQICCSNGCGHVCKPACPSVSCALYCEHGFKVNEEGCEECACCQNPCECQSFPCGHDEACLCKDITCKTEPCDQVCSCVHPCDLMDCKQDQVCVLEAVTCVTFPCSPVASCVSVCSLSADAGPCNAAIYRYFFNTKTNQCEQFSYGGCRGNANNFETEEDCTEFCKASEVIRELP